MRNVERSYRLPFLLWVCFEGEIILHVEEGELGLIA
jgi:hypothetical protein